MNEKLKKLPIGIQTFSELITEDYLYVDKTEQIHRLFADGGKYYFLSRPRRFGKSLTVSVLKEIFSGSRELFKDLWIYDKIDWKTYPVIHFDFTGLTYGSETELKKTLNYLLDENAAVYNLILKENDYDKRFKELINGLSKQHNSKVVILIDEYDKPIIDYVNQKETAVKNRNILRTFYSTIKSADKNVKFAFLTGVSKFSKVSVFSGLNNLRDITLSDKFADILGYTEAELFHYFKEYMAAFAASQTGQPVSTDELSDNIRLWYNGYSWDGSHFVYNPHSILNLFAEGNFDNYWFSTATPTLLIDAIKEKEIEVKNFEWLEVDSSVFDSYDVDYMGITSLLFQAGYLTIKKRDFNAQGEKRYFLSYPNKEVSDSFLKYLLKDFTGREFPVNLQTLTRLKAALSKKDIPGFFEIMKSVFASLPYNMVVGSREGYYQTVIYLLLKLSGAHVYAEVQTNVGRIDAVVETGKNVFIMEFKMGSEKDALDQIKEKKYHEPYLSGGKEIVLIGVGFDSEKRSIGQYVSETREGGAPDQQVPGQQQA